MILGAMAVCALGLMLIWVRLAPLPEDRLSAHPGPDLVGTHALPGGVKWVLPLAELPSDAVTKLHKIILATPRSAQVHTMSGEDMTYVTRTRFVGFPDITRVWVKDGQLHIHGHLMFGQSDLGVNAARVSGWVDQLRAGDAEI